MAMKLLAAAGWEGIEVSEKLDSLRPTLPGESTWSLDLRESALRIASLMQGPPLPEQEEARDQIVSGLPYGLPPPLVSRPF